jgi:predicted ArsR family transcriptional regulator
MLSQQMRASSHLAIEDVLCSKIRMKVLKILDGSQLTPSEIAKSIGVNFVVATKHLEVLEAEGIVEHVNFGRRIRYYRLNESSKANAVRSLIETFQHRV